VAELSAVGPMVSTGGLETLGPQAILPLHLAMNLCRPAGAAGQARSFSMREPGRIMVWLRSGPVETQPTSTPVFSSRKAM